MWARMQYERWEDEVGTNEQEEQIETGRKGEKVEENLENLDLEKSDTKLKRKMSSIVEHAAQQDLKKEKKITAA